MLADVEALLAVQEHDDRIREIERQKARILPRLESLNHALARMEEELASQAARVAADSARYRTLESRVQEHRAKHERNVEILNNAQRVREASAAEAQVDAARRLLTEEESELESLARRLADLQTAHSATARALEALKESQQEERAALQAESDELDKQIGSMRSIRDRAAAVIPAGLLSRYNRVSSRRRTRAVFALRNFTCGNCDTAIPMQRRPAMQSGKQIDVCEACGVLLYLPEVHADESAAG